jgi:hypothetical protein
LFVGIGVLVGVGWRAVGVRVGEGTDVRVGDGTDVPVGVAGSTTEPTVDVGLGEVPAGGGRVTAGSGVGDTSGMSVGDASMGVTGVEVGEPGLGEGEAVGVSQKPPSLISGTVPSDSE